MSSVLVVDDDPQLVNTVKLNLEARNFAVVTARTGRTALDLIDSRSPDLIVLDLGLPDLDGVAVLTQLRQTSRTPVIVLSARQTASDKVRALDLGADDYITKPFGMEELVARVRAVLRGRIPAAEPPSLIVQTDSFKLDLARRLAHRHGTEVHLTPTEWRLVEALTRHPGALVRQGDLLREVWGPAYGSETNYLRVYLAQLRRKLEPQPGSPRYFLTEPGVGHRFVTESGP